jgi:hypothetical protein
MSFGVNYDQEEQFFGNFICGYTISSFPHIKGITLGEHEEIYEVAGTSGSLTSVKDLTSFQDSIQFLI